MPFIIDGHNLVPHVPGLSLDMVDDENALIKILQDFAGRVQKQVEVYFDQAPVGSAGSRSFGRVKAHFVQRGITADQAIRRRLGQLGRAAKNWTVVSSDGWVQSQARHVGARVEDSASFAGRLFGAGADEGSSGDRTLSDNEVDEWLALFGDDVDE
jgi:hypothetical protein